MTSHTRKRSGKYSYILLHLAGGMSDAEPRYVLDDAMDEAAETLGVEFWIRPVQHNRKSRQAVPRIFFSLKRGGRNDTEAERIAEAVLMLGQVFHGGGLGLNASHLSFPLRSSKLRGSRPISLEALVSEIESVVDARQAKAMEALLQEPIVSRAAALGGVNERTLRRWLGEPAFRTAVFRARRESFGQAIWLTQRYAGVAVATLVKVMQDAASPPSAKVSAAGLVLKFGREGMELDDLAERVEALELGASGVGAVKAKAPPSRNGDDDSGDDAEDEA